MTTCLSLKKDDIRYRLELQAGATFFVARVSGRPGSTPRALDSGQTLPVEQLPSFILRLSADGFLPELPEPLVRSKGVRVAVPVFADPYTRQNLEGLAVPVAPLTRASSPGTRWYRVRFLVDGPTGPTFERLIAFCEAAAADAA